MRFQDKNIDLNQLSERLVRELDAEGYKTQSAPSHLGIIIQAQKAGILRDIITADRVFSILITGQPNDFTIHIGIGKWIQNIAVAVAETIFISWLFLAVDVPEMLWTEHIENTIVAKIKQLVDSAPQVEKTTTTQTSQPTSQASSPKLCPNCRFQNDPDASFCVKCGTKLK